MFRTFRHILCYTNCSCCCGFCTSGCVCVCAGVIVSVCMHASVCECVWKCRHIYVVVVAISAAFVAVAAKLSDFFCSFSDTAVMLVSS